MANLDGILVFSPSDFCLILIILMAANTVRGMMYYRRALMLQSYLESRSFGGIFSFLFFVFFPSIFGGNSYLDN